MFLLVKTKVGVTELESQDITFLKNEFPKIGDVDHDLSLFEMGDQNDLLVPSQVGDIHGNVLESPNSNRNDNDERGLVPPHHLPRHNSRG